MPEPGDQPDGVVPEVHVAATAVPARPETFDQTGPLEDVEVMTQEIGFEAEPLSQLGG